MKNILSSLKDSSVLIPFIGGYMILYGAINIITYYSQFSINIISYISFSEITIYFIKDIYVVLINLIILGILIFITVKFNNTISMESKANVELDNKMDKAESIANEISELNIISDKINKIKEFESLISNIKSSKKQEIKKLNRWMIFFYIILVLSISSLLFILYRSYSIGSWGSFIPTFLGILVALLLSYLLTKFIPDTKISIAIYFIVSLLLSSFLSAILYSHEVIKGKNIGYNFTVENIEIKSDSTNFFIGKTDKFIFYYLSKEKKTIIYPSEKIQSITIPNN